MTCHCHTARLLKDWDHEGVQCSTNCGSIPPPPATFQKESNCATCSQYAIQEIVCIAWHVWKRLQFGQASIPIWTWSRCIARGRLLEKRLRYDGESYDAWVFNSIRNSVASEVALCMGHWGKRTVAVLLAPFSCFVVSQPLEAENLRSLRLVATIRGDKIDKGVLEKVVQWVPQTVAVSGHDMTVTWHNHNWTITITIRYPLLLYNTIY